jgi:uroporphyrinogen decarboxylase
MTDGPERGNRDIAIARKRFLLPFEGRQPHVPPIWLMRQAGRYLPEYREVRAKAGGFLDLCYNPALAAEVTLQPIRRFDFDAAIIFSDILVVPQAMGQAVRFVEGEGPELDPVRDRTAVAKLDVGRLSARLASVYEAIAKAREALAPEKALIGFCGAPWTVASYMVGGRGSTDQAAARLWAYQDPDGFESLIRMLEAASIVHLSAQIQAGADCVQIFDTWAGSLSDDEFEHWVIAPTRRVVASLKGSHPHVPVIGFPRGGGLLARRYVSATNVAALGCDTTMPPQVMADLSRSTGVVVQGNLDPLLLVAGGKALEARVEAILSIMAGRPFIFNLGHGIVPETPPEHVAQLVVLVRKSRA